MAVKPNWGSTSGQIPDSDAYGYMDMRDDPYDLENKNSVVKRYTLDQKAPEKRESEPRCIKLL